MPTRKFLKDKLRAMKEDLYNTGQCVVSEITLRQVIEAIEELEEKVKVQKKEITKLKRELPYE